MKSILSCTCGDTWREHGHALLRIVTGLAFFYHGYDKVFTAGVENVVPAFQSMGIPFAGVVTYLVAYGELLGGLALILGLFTHWAAKIAIVIMIGAIGFVHFGVPGGWFFGYGAPKGYEYQLLLLASSVFLLVSGPGRFSLDARRAKQMNNGGGMSM